MSTTEDVEDPQVERTRRRPKELAQAHRQRFWSGLSTLGLIEALTFFCFSMTPSLLPRPWYLQAVATGLCVTLGYGSGVLTGWALRRLGFRPLPVRYRTPVRRVLMWVAVVLVPLFGILGAHWQTEVRNLVGVTENDGGFYPLVLLIAFLMARLLIGAVRAVRRLVRWIGRHSPRWLPRPFARLVATVVILGLLIAVINDSLVPRLLAAANQSFSISDTGTQDDVAPPTSTTRSGGPGSAVKWDDLGREGRTFVASGPTPQQISAYTGEPAVPPIRATTRSAWARRVEAESDPA